LAGSWPLIEIVIPRGPDDGRMVRNPDPALVTVNRA
jgi:hypothetical protein